MMFIACESSILVYIIAYMMYIYIYNVYAILFCHMQWILRKHIRMSSKKTRIWSFYIV